MYSLRIREDGMREPHWLITAEMGYVQTTLGDVGYRASVSAYSREVLAATFRMRSDDLPGFLFTETDPLIVTCRNLVDEARHWRRIDRAAHHGRPARCQYCSGSV